MRYKTAKRACVRACCVLSRPPNPDTTQGSCKCLCSRWVDKAHLVFFHIVTFWVHSFHQKKGIRLGNGLHLTALYVSPEDENTGAPFQRKVFFSSPVIVCIVRTYNKCSVRCSQPTHFVMILKSSQQMNVRRYKQGQTILTVQ